MFMCARYYTGYFMFIIFFIPAVLEVTVLILFLMYWGLGRLSHLLRGTQSLSVLAVPVFRPHLSDFLGNFCVLFLHLYYLYNLENFHKEIFIRILFHKEIKSLIY